MIVDQRVYRTSDGRLVLGGDLEAAFLAYTPGEEVADPLAKSSGLAALLGGAKAQPAAGNKMATRPADKAPAAEVTADRPAREKRT